MVNTDPKPYLTLSAIATTSSATALRKIQRETSAASIYRK